MQLTGAQLAMLALALGFGNESIHADETQDPSVEVQAEAQKQLDQLQRLVDEGVIAVDPQSGKPVVRGDVLKRLQEEGRLKVKLSGGGGVCPNN